MADGFLSLHRHLMEARYPDGTVSAAFRYDTVARAHLDAAVIVAHFTREGRRYVYLRSAVRPPMALRALEEERSGGGSLEAGLWELPAGLIERTGGHGEEAREAAARELREEVGFEVPAARLAPLGAPAYPAPGFIAERQFFFEVEVDPALRLAPSLDGSALEEHAIVVAVELDEALAMIRSFGTVDAKTELGLRRLVEV